MSTPTTFDTIVQSEGGYVLASLRRLGVAERDLDDLAQDVFLAVYHRWESYDPGRPPRPWLFAFAFRAAANYRRLARHRESDLTETSAVGRAQQETAILESERRNLLLRGLLELDLLHRATLILVDLDEVAPADAAVVLQVPLKTVYSRVRNGRLKLRKVIAEMQKEQM